MSLDFRGLLDRFTAAVEGADGNGLGALFTDDGIYHDTFYGEFRGRAEIAGMLKERFWGDATRFDWDMYEPVYDAAAGLGYARWVFSYTSTMEDSAGKRVAFDGMSSFRIESGLIRHYREVFSAGIAFVQLGMPPERTAKILQRIADSHAADPEWARHLAG
jgi:hypothetical protein